ncbi:hypothetical protein D4R99_05540 [bacterium]|nr:MAG: hypothetical protein D4R99_05540 [bacterium]
MKTLHGVGGAKPLKMGNIIIQFTWSVATLPILAMGLTSPFVSADDFQPQMGVPSAMAETAEKNDLLDSQAEKIDAYFKERSMPLYGFGKKMVEESLEHDLDWRLLPAIAVRESSGGKQACGHNPFGWGSCKITFKSWNEAIEVLARNLGGDNPNTSDYYSGSTKLKLHHYNGTVLASYPSEVLAIMDAIGDK